MSEQLTDNSHVQREAPSQLSETHQTPFFVFPVLEKDKLLTLPEGKLIAGRRNAVTSHERNAIQIASTHELTVRGKGVLSVARNARINGYGFVTEPAWRSRVPEYEDFTDADQLKAHKHGLELHNHTVLLELLQKRANIETDTRSKERHEIEVEFIKAFGEFVLTHRI